MVDEIEIFIYSGRAISNAELSNFRHRAGEHGIELSVGFRRSSVTVSVGRLLRSLGLSPQRPLFRAFGRHTTTGPDDSTTKIITALDSSDSPD